MNYTNKLPLTTVKYWKSDKSEFVCHCSLADIYELEIKSVRKYIAELEYCKKQLDIVGIEGNVLNERLEEQLNEQGEPSEELLVIRRRPNFEDEVFEYNDLIIGDLGYIGIKCFGGHEVIGIKDFKDHEVEEISKEEYDRISSEYTSSKDNHSAKIISFKEEDRGQELDVSDISPIIIIMILFFISLNLYELPRPELYEIISLMCISVISLKAITSFLKHIKASLLYRNTLAAFIFLSITLFTMNIMFTKADTIGRYNSPISFDRFVSKMNSNSARSYCDKTDFEYGCFLYINNITDTQKDLILKAKQHIVNLKCESLSDRKTACFAESSDIKSHRLNRDVLSDIADESDNLNYYELMNKTYQDQQ
ncbi:hypothetical protein LLJ53_11155 [Pseudomonas aeruginosa]|uniref:hypothetical protein n=1 Tax=Pseudomonas aeruginosa TaxID=287 RepID=UPI0021E3E7AF|nr:hypothetical protein [Pseudomonas aeruginosa]UYF86562.1 hypothetical protein LLJ53_11155 [Pseudomonas aeruginosa]